MRVQRFVVRKDSNTWNGLSVDRSVALGNKVRFDPKGFGVIEIDAKHGASDLRRFNDEDKMMFQAAGG